MIKTLGPGELYNYISLLANCEYFVLPKVMLNVSWYLEWEGAGTVLPSAQVEDKHDEEDDIYSHFSYSFFFSSTKHYKFSFLLVKHLHWNNYISTKQFIKRTNMLHFFPPNSLYLRPCFSAPGIDFTVFFTTASTSTHEWPPFQVLTMAPAA